MTQQRATPSIKRRRVGAQLRRWREEMGVASGDAARAMGWSQARFSRVERGYYRIGSDEVHKLCAWLGVKDAEAVDEVSRAAEEPTGKGWWAAYSDKIGETYMDFIMLEAEAETIRVQHPKVIPGLLQSPGYVRELLGNTPAFDSEALIAIRMARQAVLGRATYHAVVPESAFHAQFSSGPGLMRDQLRKLLDAAEMPNVTLQVLPLTAHPSYGSNGATTILTYCHPWSPVASVDNRLGGSHTYEMKEVDSLAEEFDGIAAAALSVDESRELLTEHLEGMYK